jgi:hypothetical protein
MPAEGGDCSAMDVVITTAARNGGTPERTVISERAVRLNSCGSLEELSFAKLF